MRSLADTVSIAQFIFQTLLWLLLFISVFGIGNYMKKTYLKKPKSEHNEFHEWWTNAFSK